MLYDMGQFVLLLSTICMGFATAFDHLFKVRVAHPSQRTLTAFDHPSKVLQSLALTPTHSSTRSLTALARPSHSSRKASPPTPAGATPGPLSWRTSSVPTSSTVSVHSQFGECQLSVRHVRDANDA